jgi:CubicO group peptidase (beta-lactamase class C family)
MSSGLVFDEGYDSPLSDVLKMLYSNLLDKAAFAANKPVEAPPDTLWHYSSGTSVILAGILDAIEEPT